MNWKLKEKIAEGYRTQADFSYAVCRPESVVSKVVRGRRTLTAAEQQRWAELLGTDSNILFGKEATDAKG